MAKISARGARELARATFARDRQDDNVSWEKNERVLRSDGAVLSRHTVRFRASQYCPERLHTWGWKIKTKPGRVITDSYVLVWAEEYKRLGWSVEVES